MIAIQGMTVAFSSANLSQKMLLRIVTLILRWQHNRIFTRFNIWNVKDNFTIHHPKMVYVADPNQKKFWCPYSVFMLVEMTEKQVACLSASTELWSINHKLLSNVCLSNSLKSMSFKWVNLNLSHFGKSQMASYPLKQRMFPQFPSPPSKDKTRTRYIKEL